MNLEEALREAAAKGLTHITLWPVASHDRKKTYWYARATPSTGHSYISANGDDPVEVMMQVLDALPKAPKRVAKVKIDPNHVAEPAPSHPLGYPDGMPNEITAAVNEPAPPDTLEAWLPKG